MMRWLRKIVEKRDDKEILSMDSEKRITILEKELKKLKKVMKDLSI